MGEQSNCPCGAGCNSTSPSDWLARRIAIASRGFEAVVGRRVSGFCCPLCAKELPLSCASVADCPAKAVGGRPLTFLCKRCNNFLGQEFESAAAMLLKSRVPGSPGVEVMRVKFGRKGGPQTYHRARVDHSPNGPSLDMDALGKVTDYVKQAAKDESRGPFILQFKGHNEGAAKLAFLSWAFLGLFAKFGYSYALGASARPVRAALLRNEKPTFGEFFFLTSGELTLPVPRPLAAIVCKHAAAARQWHPISLGVALGNVTVSVPMSGDPDGDRIRALDAFGGPGTVLNAVVAPFPVERWWPRAAGDHSGTRCTYLFTMEDGSLLAAIDTPPQVATDTLANPLEARTEENREPRSWLRSDWTATVRALPTSVEPGRWASAVVQDLIERLGQLATDDLTTRLQSLEGVAPDVLRRSIAPRLPGYLVQHVDDQYRLLFLRERRAVADDEHPDVVGHEALRMLRDAHVDRECDCGLTSTLLDLEMGAVQHTLCVAGEKRELLVGPFYAARTLLAAVRELVPHWLAEEEAPPAEA
jgi:hypothetical protein